MTHEVLKFLLIEDNLDDILLMEEVIEEIHAFSIVKSVANEEEALLYLKEATSNPEVAMPDLVLVDINMPKKNGFEILRTIKADPTLRFLPIIIFSSSNRPQDIMQAYADGACSFIRKPFGFEELKILMEDLVRYWETIAWLPSFEKSGFLGSEGK